MCGIVGIHNAEPKYSHKIPEIMKELLFMSTLRGWDSTGMALIPADLKKDPTIYKKVVPGVDFILLEPVNTLLKKEDYSLLLGHTRAATKGTVSKANAHPFIAEGDQGDYILVHNGTIYNKQVLPDGNKFDTDSEAICNAFAKIGVKETIKLIDGSFSLVWYQGQDDTLNFIRNEKRPMKLMVDNFNNRTYFASEENMLRWIAERNSLQIKTINEIPEKKWIQYDLSDNSKVVFMEELDFYKPTVYQYHHYDDSWKNEVNRVPKRTVLDHESGYWSIENGVRKFIPYSEGIKGPKAPSKGLTTPGLGTTSKTGTELYKNIFQNEYRNKYFEFDVISIEENDKGVKTVYGVIDDDRMCTVRAYIKPKTIDVRANDTLKGKCHGWTTGKTHNGGQELILILHEIKHVIALHKELDKRTGNEGEGGLSLVLMAYISQWTNTKSLSNTDVLNASVTSLHQIIR
jgi:predicted glutamine amidotransferase